LIDYQNLPLYGFIDEEKTFRIQILLKIGDWRFEYDFFQREFENVENESSLNKLKEILEKGDV